MGQCWVSESDTGNGLCVVSRDGPEKKTSIVRRSCRKREKKTRACRFSVCAWSRSQANYVLPGAQPAWRPKRAGGRAEERAKVLAEVVSGENPDGLADMFSGQREEGRKEGAAAKQRKWGAVQPLFWPLLSVTDSLTNLSTKLVTACRVCRVASVCIRTANRLCARNLLKSFLVNDSCPTNHSLSLHHDHFLTARRHASQPTRVCSSSLLPTVSPAAATAATTATAAAAATCSSPSSAAARVSVPYSTARRPPTDPRSPP